MSSIGRATITFELDYDFGPVDGKWTVAELHRRAHDEAQHAASRVVSVVAKHANERLRITKVEPRTTIVTVPEDR